MRNVVAGGLPLGAVATPAAINAWTKDNRSRYSVAPSRTRRTSASLTLPDRGIEAIEDVRGKRVGFAEPGSITQGCAVLSLRAAGIDPGEVELQAMGGLSEALTGLTEGAIDPGPAAVAICAFDERGAGVRAVFQTSEYVGEFPQLSMIATEQAVQQQPELLQALIELYQQAVDFLIENPQEAAAAWANNSEVAEEDALASLEAIDPSQYSLDEPDRGGFEHGGR